MSNAGSPSVPLTTGSVAVLFAAGSMIWTVLLDTGRTPWRRPRIVADADYVQRASCGRGGTPCRTLNYCIAQMVRAAAVIKPTCETKTPARGRRFVLHLELDPGPTYIAVPSGMSASCAYFA